MLIPDLSDEQKFNKRTLKKHGIFFLELLERLPNSIPSATPKHTYLQVSFLSFAYLNPKANQDSESGSGSTNPTEPGSATMTLTMTKATDLDM
jgi:hypothetical protein